MSNNGYKARMSCRKSIVPGLVLPSCDVSGNYVNAFSVPLVTYGKSQHQAEATNGDAVARVIAYAREVGKPIVIERLDFREKKAALEGESQRYSRMLSGFSYGKVKAYLLSRGYREGVEVHQVNPAFPSVIGRVKFMERYGLSVHQAAALVLARHLLGCSERIPFRRVCPNRQWRPGRLHRTREEAGEACVDALWRSFGTVETGACSATPAGGACARTQSGSGSGLIGIRSVFPGEIPGWSRLALLGRRRGSDRVLRNGWRWFCN